MPLLPLDAVDLADVRLETPLTLILPPNARPAPARTPETTSHAGNPAQRFGRGAETGEKLWVAVSR